MDKFHNQLKIAFASEFSFYLKAHYFHWNVEGPRFKELHDLFAIIYEEVYGQIDVFAENIRKAKAYTPGSLTRFSSLTEINDEQDVPTAEQMVEELHKDADKMVEIFRHLFMESEKHHEHGLSDFLGMRMDAYQKHAWMLRATGK